MKLINLCRGGNAGKLPEKYGMLPEGDVQLKSRKDRWLRGAEHDPLPCP